MNIIYEFDIPEFYAAEGYVSIHVSDGKLVLDTPPDQATLVLIEKMNGRLLPQDQDEKGSDSGEMVEPGTKEVGNGGNST
jgi:hypothetical protein